jgi:hypothetical protein
VGGLKLELSQIRKPRLLPYLFGKTLFAIIESFGKWFSTKEESLKVK